jgi:hypothetical protein
VPDFAIRKICAGAILAPDLVTLLFSAPNLVYPFREAVYILIYNDSERPHIHSIGITFIFISGEA